MKTTCEVCLFAVRNEGKQSQEMPCILNKIDKFEKEYEDNHYLLEGLCNFCRNKNWVFYLDNPDLSVNEYLEEIYREENMKYEVVIYFSSVEKTLATLESIKQLSVEPQNVTIVTNLPFKDASNVYLDVLNASKMKYLYVQSSIEEQTIDAAMSSFLSSDSKKPIESRVFVKDGTLVDNRFINSLNELKIEFNHSMHFVTYTSDLFLLSYKMSRLVAAYKEPLFNTLMKLAAEYDSQHSNNNSELQQREFDSTDNSECVQSDC